MECTLINKDKKSNRVDFELSGVNPGIANALRRTMLERVPTMAIEIVEFKKNNSAVYDEVVAHRLGLLPLVTDLKSYTLPALCTCSGEGCAKCELKMTLKTSATGWVAADQIKSKDPKVVCVYPGMPIVKLLKGQDIEFEATAQLGVGADHAKWSPGLIWYEYKPTITVNAKSPKLSEYKSQYPKKAFDSSGKLSKENILKHNLIEACVGVCDDIVSVTYSDNEFLFHIEPWGQLSAQEILTTATQILVEDLNTFLGAFKQAK